jgi:hypothetical protein
MGGLMEKKILKVKTFWSEEDKGYITILEDDINLLSAFGKTMSESIYEFSNVIKLAFKEEESEKYGRRHDDMDEAERHEYLNYPGED